MNTGNCIKAGSQYDARVHACIVLRWACVTWGQLGAVVRVLGSRSLGLTVQYQVHVPVWGGVSLILAFMARWITPVHPCTELNREKNIKKFMSFHNQTQKCNAEECKDRIWILKSMLALQRMSTLRQHSVDPCVVLWTSLNSQID